MAKGESRRRQSYHCPGPAVRYCAELGGPVTLSLPPCLSPSRSAFALVPLLHFFLRTPGLHTTTIHVEVRTLLFSPPYVFVFN